MTMNCDTWPTPVDNTCYGGCTIPDATDPDLLAAAAVQAGNILWVLSGHQVGTCEDVLRPLSECGTCRGWCHCGSGDRIRVSSFAGPVSDVTEVKLDGTIVDPSGYRYYPSGQLLYRVPPDVWPYRDNKTADCDDPETMCVTAVIGTPPDAWALAVHAELTCELLLACSGGKCRIPSNATQVTAQGISITLSPTELKQFIPSVAGWVAAINPANAQSVPMVFSPDLGWPNGYRYGY